MGCCGSKQKKVKNPQSSYIQKDEKNTYIPTIKPHIDYLFQKVDIQVIDDLQMKVQSISQLLISYSTNMLEAKSKLLDLFLIENKEYQLTKKVLKSIFQVFLTVVIQLQQDPDYQARLTVSNEYPFIFLSKFSTNMPKNIIETYRFLIQYCDCIAKNDLRYNLLKSEYEYGITDISLSDEKIMNYYQQEYNCPMTQEQLEIAKSKLNENIKIFKVEQMDQIIESNKLCNKEKQILVQAVSDIKDSFVKIQERYQGTKLFTRGEFNLKKEFDEIFKDE